MQLDLCHLFGIEQLESIQKMGLKLIERIHLSAFMIHLLAIVLNRQTSYYLQLMKKIVLRVSEYF